MNGSKAHNTLKALGTMLLVSIFTLSFLTIFLCDYDFPNGNKTVYTTQTGECYHLKDCPTLQYSQYKTTLREAVEEGYRSCSRCDSPILKGEDGFSFEWYFYLIVVPFSALWSWAATSEILKYSNIHYIIHLLVNLLLATLIDLVL